MKLSATIVQHGPIVFRGSLYFIASFLTSMVDKIGPFLDKGEWPSWPRMVLGFLIGTTNGVIAVRAFYDGSAERHKDEQAPIAEAEQRKAVVAIEHDTAMIQKPVDTAPKM